MQNVGLWRGLAFVMSEAQVEDRTDSAKADLA
jgi:hypothetical protein